MYAKNVQHFFEELHSQKTPEEYYNTLEKVCLNFGLDKFALAIFYGDSNVLENFSLHDTYPKEWMDRYKKKQYYLCDPVFKALQKISMPFEWSLGSCGDILPIQRIILEEAHDFGVKSGTTIPLIPKKSSHGFVTLLSPSSLHPEVVYIISLMANYCVDKLRTFLHEQLIYQLSKREKEILSLKSQGLPVKKITLELGISLPTINFHLKNIRNKLNVISTEQSVLKFNQAQIF